MFFSVIIPTYNRLPILVKCVAAISHQESTYKYEIIIIDDGSTDGTIEWITKHQNNYPRLTLYRQQHQGAAIARNLGLTHAQGDYIIFIDSDLIVTENFIQAHGTRLSQASLNNDRIFTYGWVINTNNFDNPQQEPFKITDFSAAYFATGNVAIAKKWLDQAGRFDPTFSLYGWEDLELGIRLKKLGLKLIKCPQAVGYHWHPPFKLDQIPAMIQREIERAKMGLIFYQKHPTWEVRMMIQMTPLHWMLWFILSLGGLLNEKSLTPLLQWLINHQKSQLALEISRIFLNWYNVQAIYQAYHTSKSP